MNNDSPTPDAVTIITTVTVSEKKRTYAIWHICCRNTFTVMFLQIQMKIPTNRLDFEMNCWSIQAPTDCANHHESFIYSQGAEVFQDDPFLLQVSVHNWDKSHTSGQLDWYIGKSVLLTLFHAVIFDNKLCLYCSWIHTCRCMCQNHSIDQALSSTYQHIWEKQHQG